MYLLAGRITSNRPPDVVRDAWRDIARDGMQALAAEWHEKFLADHFTPQARAKYRHKLRNRQYRERKARMASEGKPYRPGDPSIAMGGQIDNVLTGYMKKQLEENPAIAAFPSRVTLRMYGPKYLSARTFTGDTARAIREGWTFGRGRKFHARMGNQPDKIREVTMVTREQNMHLARVLEQRVQLRLEQYRATKVIEV